MDFNGYNNYYQEPASDFFSSVIGYIILILIIYMIFKAIRLASLMERVISQNIWWVENAKVTADGFYNDMKERIMRHSTPEVSFDKMQIQESPGGMSDRVCLKITFRKHLHVIAVSPFANGFAISCRHIRPLAGFEVILVAIPFIGKALLRFFYSDTFYTIDTHASFNAIVDRAFKECIDEVAKEPGAQIIRGGLGNRDVREAMGI